MHDERRRTLLTLKLAVACLMVTLLTTVTASCGSSKAELEAQALTGGGVPSRGREKIRKYGCTSCHTIPGIPEADSMVGPPLTKMAGRTYIAGVMENNPDNMIRWLENPPAVDKMTAMPNLGVTDEDARDIAGYLYTLK